MKCAFSDKAELCLQGHRYMLQVVHCTTLGLSDGPPRIEQTITVGGEPVSLSLNPRLF